MPHDGYIVPEIAGRTGSARFALAGTEGHARTDRPRGAAPSSAALSETRTLALTATERRSPVRNRALAPAATSTT